MENKFIIDNGERQRILSLHENSTKQQYLNVLSEQTTPQQKVSYTLMATTELENVKDKTALPELKIFKGAVFELENNRMVAKNATIQFVNSLTGYPTVSYNNGATVTQDQYKKVTYER
jgi:hypothetical protein